MEGQFQFFSLNKKMDWEKGRAWNIQATDQGLSLRQVDKHVFEKKIQLDERSLRSPINHFTLGRQGHLFLLDQQANLWRYDIENDYVESLFSAGHGLFSAEALLTCSEETLYIADRREESSILSAYSIRNGQILWSVQDWMGKQLNPLALAIGQADTLYVLLQDQERPVSKLHIVEIRPSGNMKWVTEHKWEDLDHLELRLGGSQTPPALFSRRFAMQVNHLGEILVLDTATRELLRFSQSGTLVDQLNVKAPYYCSGFALDSNNHIYLGDQRTISIDQEDNRFLVRLDAQGKFDGQLLAYRGRADDVQIDEKDRIYIWNEQEQSITMLTLRPRTMELGRSGALSGLLISTSLDGGSTELVWHRLVVNAEIAEETQLRISYFTSDRRNFLIHGEYVDVDDFIMDERNGMERILDGLSTFWSQAIINPKDALLFQAQGRYIWLKIEFVGSEQHTPLLHNMRVYYPRMSLLSYLPAVYQEDEKSRDFLERYLSLYGTFLFDMEEQIEQTPRYFDAEGVSGPYLRWLATWLGFELNDGWEEPQIRELISCAPELYRARGTRWAIEKVIEIYTGEKPFIIEHFQYKHLLDMTELRELLEGLYGKNPYQFCILVKGKYVRNEKQRMMLETIVNEQKPAFTEAQLIILEPRIYMDMHAYLGINTYLSELSLMRLDHQSAMPNDTVLIDIDQENRIGVHTRLELDAELE